MAKKLSKEVDRVLSATGPAGPIPRTAYCTPQCYARGIRDRARSCECKGCGGKAHGREKKYAFDHGYLKDSPPGSRKVPTGQEPLFPEESTDPADLAIAPDSNGTCPSGQRDPPARSGSANEGGKTGKRNGPAGETGPMSGMDSGYAASVFFAALTAGLGAAFLTGLAFSFAANSCLTLAVRASVSTL